MPVQQLHLPISSEPRLRRIAEALAQDPADRSTLAEWANRVALSESSLARLIVKETGLSFGRWRQQLHLIVAIRELASGASVQQVSGDLGYESVTAFITMFKKALGKPPAKYLGEHRAQWRLRLRGVINAPAGKPQAGEGSMASGAALAFAPALLRRCRGRSRVRP